MIYLDNSATTKVDRHVAELMMRYLTDQYGNPSSLHSFGIESLNGIANARYQIARMLAADTEDIYFTSGGTEANNLAVLGSARASGKKHVITTSIEHSSVLDACKQLEREGYSVTYIKPDPLTHRILTEDILKEIRDDTALISMMYVNNETGEILPVKEVFAKVKELRKDIVLHTDCVQAFGKIPVKVHELHSDLISASAHKIHGPKGTGMLYKRKGVPLQPLEYGGKQEKKINPGTENLAGIVGFGEAAEISFFRLDNNLEHVISLQSFLKEELKRRFPSLLYNSFEDSLPYILNISFPDESAQTIIDKLNLKDIYVSSGSACLRGAKSHVLESSGYDEKRIEGSIRISFSSENTNKDLEEFINALEEIVK